MSKKGLNLNSLTSNRKLRSAKQVDDLDLTRNKSEFFDTKDEKAENVPKTKKKSAPVKIKDEPEDEEKLLQVTTENEKESKARTKCTPTKTKHEDNDVQSNKSTEEVEEKVTETKTRKKRNTTKIKCEDNDDELDKSAEDVDKGNVPKTRKKRIPAEAKCEDNDVELDKSAEDVAEKDKEPKVKKKRTPVKIKYEENDSEQQSTEPVTKKEKWVPENWEATLKNIREMRKNQTAPVDEMGCHKCADPNANESDHRYQCLVALMLSSQTKDQVTHAAMTNLIENGCSAEIMSTIPDEELEKLIYPVGFYKRKVVYIKRTAEILKRKYHGDIPRTVKELCNLPGVGPKMAHICMKIAWNEVSGIGVDTHVHRICNRLRWTKKETKTPEETRIALEDWLPRELWSEVNHLLVGFGQEICLPQRPKCSECLNKDICPFAPKTKKLKP